MKRLMALLCASLLITGCSAELPAETSGAPETPAPPAETTASPETAETTEAETETVTEDVTEEVTEPPFSIEGLSADEIRALTEELGRSYRSYVRVSRSESSIAVLGETAESSVDSELRVNGANAVFRRGKDDEFEHLILSDGELYRAGACGSYRIGGYDKNKFLSMISDGIEFSHFAGGSITFGESGAVLRFDKPSEEGLTALRAMLSIGEEFEIIVDRAELTLEVGNAGDMLAYSVALEFRVDDGGEELLAFSLETHTEQSEINGDFTLERPKREDFAYFPSEEAAALYEIGVSAVDSFTLSHPKFEYTLRDDKHIAASGLELSLPSTAVYAYSDRVGASIDKSFDIADGTGAHKTLTHFNFRRGFSQIDGGSIFVDTTLNAGNLEFTLSYPFKTSFFALAQCTGVDTSRSSGNTLALTLTDSAAQSIARNLLVRAGVITSEFNLTDVTAYTYLTLNDDGSLAAIGYEFSAKATAARKDYKLSQSVSLTIDSDDSANVKVIYIEVEDDEEDRSY